jgi:Protein tyrosine phosphatase-like protein, PTPLA
LSALSLHRRQETATMASLKESDYYLIAYNALCLAGWAQVLLGSLRFLYQSYFIMEDIWSGLEAVFFSGPVDFLIVVQLLALMEIGHAAVGLVRSPVLVTTMQVMSRVVVLFPCIFSTTGASKCRFPNDPLKS